MVFANRKEAGELLALEFKKRNLNSSQTLIVAVPRGGILVAKEIAAVFNFPLTVLVIKKIGAPNNSELAIGATASFGKPVLDRWLIADLNVSGDYLKKETVTKKKRRRRAKSFWELKLIRRDLEVGL